MNEIKELAPYIFQVILLVIFFTKMDSRLKAIEDQVKELRSEMKISSEKINKLEKEILENKVRHEWMETIVASIKAKLGLEV